MTSAAGGDSLHIVVFPWLALGHMMPFLELSKSLAVKGHRISFVCTPKNIRRLPQIPSALSSLITYTELQLPAVPGLPEHAEATTDLLPDEVAYLKRAVDAFREPFARFLREASSSSTPPDWVIHDFTHHWLGHVASDMGVRTVFFSTVNAATMAFLGPPSELLAGRSSRESPEELTVSPPWVPFSSKVALRLHEARKMVLDNVEDVSSGVSDLHRVWLSVEGCDAVAVRSCAEVEGKWLRLLPELYRKPVIPVGLLPPAVQEDAADGDSNDILRWLDGRTAGSVVYVAFGSEATLSVEHLHEVALGLELSGLPFLWALRPPAGLPAAAAAGLLPDRFEERTRARGLVVLGWVPQVRVLAHPAVGSFLTHAGWSSIIEAARFGHPLVLLPIFGDQYLNARLAEEAVLGVEVRRGDEDGSFWRQDVAAAVRSVAVEAEGERVRGRAKELSLLLSSERGRHDRHVEDFANFLVQHRGRRLASPPPERVADSA